jgi:hypothetical protein
VGGPNFDIGETADTRFARHTVVLFKEPVLKTGTKIISADPSPIHPAFYNPKQ